MALFFISVFSGTISTIRINLKEYLLREVYSNQFTSPQKTARSNKIVKFYPGQLSVDNILNNLLYLIKIIGQVYSSCVYSLYHSVCISSQYENNKRNVTVLCNIEIRFTQPCSNVKN